MAFKIKDNLDLYGFILQNFCIDNQTSLDSLGDKNLGRMVFLTGNGTNAAHLHPHIYDGNKFRAIAYMDDVASNEDFIEVKRKVDAFFDGTVDVEGVIDNLEDIQDFLNNYSDATDLASILKGKLDTSGGELTGSLTIGSGNWASQLVLKGVNEQVGIKFQKDNTHLGYLVVNEAKKLLWQPAGTAYAVIHEGNYADTLDNSYLKLSGGMLQSATGDMSPLHINGNGTYSAIAFTLNASNDKAYLAYDGAKLLFANKEGAWNTLLHLGNYATYIDKTHAKTDGSNASGTWNNSAIGFAPQLIKGTLVSDATTNRFFISRNGVQTDLPSGQAFVGGFTIAMDENPLYKVQLAVSSYGGIYTREMAGASSYGDWRTVAFTSSNVESANRLTSFGNPTTDTFSDYFETYKGGVTVLENRSGAAVGNISAYDTVLNIGNTKERFGRLTFVSGNEPALFLQTANDSATGWGIKKSVAFTSSTVAAARKLTTDSYVYASYSDSSKYILLGATAAEKGYNTYVDGNNIYFRYGGGYSSAMLINSSGNVTIGSEDKAGADAKLYVDGQVKTLGHWGSNLGIDDISTTENHWNGSKSSLLLCNNNNALSVLVSAKQNERKAIIQVGHSSTTYADSLGSLHLNPFGGNVLIGTNTDNGSGAKLQVKGSISVTTDIIGASNSTYDKWSLSHSNNTFFIQSGYSDGSSVYGKMMLSGVNVNNLSVLTIRANDTTINGNVLIGTTVDSGYKLHLIGNSRFTDYILADRYNGQGNIAGASILVNKGGNRFGIGPCSTNVSRISFGYAKGVTSEWDSEIMTFDEGGNVGFGTKSPNAKMEVVGVAKFKQADNTYINLEDSLDLKGGAGISFFGASGFQRGTITASTLLLNAKGGGSVLVGATEDNGSGAKLQVNGGASFTDGLNIGGDVIGAKGLYIKQGMQCDNGTDGAYFGSAKQSYDGSTGGVILAYGANPLKFVTNGTTRMTITGSGGVVSDGVFYAKQSAFFYGYNFYGKDKEGIAIYDGGIKWHDALYKTASGSELIDFTATGITLQKSTLINKTSSDVPALEVYGETIIHGNLRVMGNLVADVEVSAGGAGQQGESGGGSGSGDGVIILNDWSKYSEALPQVVGANLGVSLKAKLDEIDKALNLDDTQKVIDTWNEVQEFFGTISEDLDFMGFLNKKADKGTTLADYGITDAINTAGGTITGNLLFDHTAVKAAGIKFKDHRIGSSGYSDNIITITNSSDETCGVFGLLGYASGVEYYHIGHNGSSGNNLRIYKDKVTFGADTLLHTGNYALFIDKTHARNDGSNASGTWGIAITGSASSLTPYYVNNLDNALENRFFHSGFQAANRPATNYGTGFTISNSELGYLHQLAFDSDNYIYARRKKNDTWEGWKKLAFADEVLSSSGGTISGSLHIGKTDNSAFNCLQITRAGYGARINNLSSGAYVSFGSVDSSNTLTVSSSLLIKTDSLMASFDGNTTWKTLLHTGNYASYALPLSGGTINGDLTIGKEAENTTRRTLYMFTKHKLDGTDTEVQSRAGLYTNGTGDVELSYYCSTDSTYKRLVMGHSGLKIGGYNYEMYDILHTGNYGDYALKIDGSNKMLGRIDMNIYALQWDKNDNNQLLVPLDADSSQLGYYNGTTWKQLAFTDSDITGYAAGLKHSNGTIAAVVNSSGNVTIGPSDWAGSKWRFFVDKTAMFQAYNDNMPTLGNAATNVVHIGQEKFGMQLWATYGGVASIQSGRIDGTATAYNLSLQPLGGNVLIGTTTDKGEKLQVNGGVSISGAISATLNRQSEFTSLLTAFVPDLKDGDRAIIAVGKANAYAKKAALVFCNKEGDYNKSYGSLGLYGLDDLITFNGYGNVGIGTTNPAYKLDVNGVAKTLGLRCDNVCIECDANGNTSGYGGEINRLGGGQLWIQSREGGLQLGNSASVTNFNGSVTMSKTLNVAGATTMTGLLTANGGATINGNLHVTGNIVADGEVSAGGAGSEGATGGGSGSGLFKQMILEHGEKTYNFEHKLNTEDIIVCLYERHPDTGNWRMILADIEILSPNEILITFGKETDVDHKVVVLGGKA